MESRLERVRFLQLEEEKIKEDYNTIRIINLSNWRSVL